MVLGWRKAFCTSIPKDQEWERETNLPIIKDKPNSKPGSRIGGFFSNPSTPRLGCRISEMPPPPNTVLRSNSAPQSPKLQCKTRTTSRFFQTRSTPSSPRSPSTFSLVKSTLRLSKNRCGICLQSVKTGQGTAIFTAECGHNFHFPCIAVHIKKQCTLTCPICNSTWKEMHLLNSNNNQTENGEKRCVVKVYNDDEPLSSPNSGARFNPIPESDETDEKSKNVEVNLMSETVSISVGKTTETYATLLKIKAPPSPLRRAPIDLVTVLNVSKSISTEQMQLMKRAMRLIVSSLSAADRLSIVAYSSTSKRLLPLRKMCTAGRRAARRIIDAMITLDNSSTTSAAESLKKAAKVLEDRREINPSGSIIHFSDSNRSSALVSSTRSSILEIPIHSFNLSACLNACPETVTNSITGLLSVVIQDLRIRVGFTSSDSHHCEISAVYSSAGRPVFLGSGSSWCRVGQFYSEEERELLIELKVPLSSSSSSTKSGARHRLLTVRCSQKDPSNQQPVYDKEIQLSIHHENTTQRLKYMFLSTRAVAESRRLIERNDVVGAHYMLVSTRALVLKSGTGSELVRGLDAELAELRRREVGSVGAEDKAEALTPTSAWRVAERLAKVAIMKKSLNRVSDLHGFENARF